MKIAQVYPFLHICGVDDEPSDAMSVLIGEISGRLARKDAVVVYKQSETGRDHEFSRDGVLYRALDSRFDAFMHRRRLLRRTIRKTPIPYVVSVFENMGLARRIADDLARGSFDVIHVHSCANFLPAIRKANPRALLILHMHDNALVDFDARYYADSLEKADFVLGCSAHLAHRLAEKYPGIADRISALPNAVDEGLAAWRAGSARHPGRILYVGRISPEKGIHVLVDAFRQVAAARPDAVLELVGPVRIPPPLFVDPMQSNPLLDDVRRFTRKPPEVYRDHLRSLAEPFGERVVFRGRVPHARIGEFYDGAEVFAFPSLWDEPFGIPVVEAALSGLPVVATKGGAFPEIVADAETGLLVPPGDPSALAAALLELLEDSGLRQRFGQAGRKLAQDRFTWRTRIEDLRALYATGLKRASKAA